MNKLAAALLALTTLALPLAASAQDHQRPAPEPTVTHYTFEYHPVAWRDYDASGELLRVRAHRHDRSLIRVREHFADELRKSAENF